MVGAVQCHEIYEAMSLYGLTYSAAWYRLRNGVPIQRPYHPKKIRIAPRNRSQKQYDAPCEQIIVRGRGRPGLCIFCEFYPKCLDYAAKYDWLGWKFSSSKKGVKS